MQSVSSRVWTRVAVSIPYDDNHYTTGNYCDLTLIILFYINHLFAVKWLQVLLLTPIIQLNSIHSFAHNEVFPSITM